MSSSSPVPLVVQYMSDLHLELFPGFRIPASDVTGDILVLAGDIGTVPSREYTEFVRDCVTKFRRGVFVVLGNHEAYDNDLTWSETVEEARVLLKAIGASLLHRDVVDLGPDLKIVGTTLWSHVDDHEASTVRCFMSDYRRIKGICSSTRTSSWPPGSLATPITPASCSTDCSSATRGAMPTPRPRRRGSWSARRFECHLDVRAT